MGAVIAGWFWVIGPKVLEEGLATSKLLNSLVTVRDTFGNFVFGHLGLNQM